MSDAPAPSPSYRREVAMLRPVAPPLNPYNPPPPSFGLSVGFLAGTALVLIGWIGAIVLICARVLL